MQTKPLLVPGLITLLATPDFPSSSKTHTCGLPPLTGEMLYGAAISGKAITDDLLDIIEQFATQHKYDYFLLSYKAVVLQDVNAINALQAPHYKARLEATFKGVTLPASSLICALLITRGLIDRLERYIDGPEFRETRMYLTRAYRSIKECLCRYFSLPITWLSSGKSGDRVDTPKATRTPRSPYGLLNRNSHYGLGQNL